MVETVKGVPTDEFYGHIQNVQTESRSTCKSLLKAKSQEQIRSLTTGWGVAALITQCAAD